MLQALADTQLDSEERFRARAALPGMAKRLRELGPAVAKVVDTLGGSDEAAFSSRYGGEATSLSPAEAVYKSIGTTITISGRCGSRARCLPGRDWCAVSAEGAFRLLVARSRLLEHPCGPAVLHSGCAAGNMCAGEHPVLPFVRTKGTVSASRWGLRAAVTIVRAASSSTRSPRSHGGSAPSSGSLTTTGLCLQRRDMITKHQFALHLITDSTVIPNYLPQFSSAPLTTTGLDHRSLLSGYRATQSS